MVLESPKKAAESSDSPFVFPGCGKTGHLVAPNNAGNDIRDAAGIADLRPNDLRRPAGTGANLSVIGRSLNHKSTTTGIYARIWMEPVGNSMETATTARTQAAGLVATDDSESDAAEE